MGTDADFAVQICVFDTVVIKNVNLTDVEIFLFVPSYPF